MYIYGFLKMMISHFLGGLFVNVYTAKLFLKEIWNEKSILTLSPAYKAVIWHLLFFRQLWCLMSTAIKKKKTLWLIYSLTAYQGPVCARHCWRHSEYGREQIRQNILLSWSINKKQNQNQTRVLLSLYNLSEGS